MAGGDGRRRMFSSFAMFACREQYLLCDVSCGFLWAAARDGERQDCQLCLLLLTPV